MQEGKLNNSRRMAAGFAAGVTEALMIVTPFEVVKIRLQQQQGSNKAALLYKVGTVAGVAPPQAVEHWEGQAMKVQLLSGCKHEQPCGSKMTCHADITGLGVHVCTGGAHLGAEER
jgi:Mitochondrial carrier protein